jgi:hypothetical protein
VSRGRANKLIGRIILIGLRAFLRLPDHILARIFNFLSWLINTVSPGQAAATTFFEFAEVFGHHPDEATVVRNFFLKSRTTQGAALFSGILKHHARACPYPFDALKAKTAKTLGQSTYKIAFMGSNGDTPGLASAYSEIDDLTVVPVSDELPSGNWTGLEVGVLPPGGPDSLERLPWQRPLSVGYPALDSYQTTKRLFDLARIHRARIRVAYPYFYYSPVLKLKELIKAGEIGEPATIRVRAIAGRGSEVGQSVEEWLSHPAFDHFPLLTFFGGPIQSTAAYLNPMNPDQGGQGVTAIRFERPGLYGSLECTLAPDLVVKTDHQPYDLEVEIAGSDGIIWMRRGMGRRSSIAPIMVRTGRQAYTIGVECGFPSDWNQVYRQMALEFLNVIHGGRTLVDKSIFLNALAARETSLVSDRLHRVVRLDERNSHV